MSIEFKSVEEIRYCNDEKKGDLGWGGFASVKLIYHYDFPDKFFALKLLKKSSPEEDRFII